MEQTLSRTIKGYQLLDLIGEGAYGAVYRAQQEAVDREVAVKIILPEFANRPDFIRRFETEAQLVAQLEHLHIVSLYDYWRDPDGAYLVMRLMKGGSLQDLINEGPLSLSHTARLLDQIGSALSAAHRRKVIHRDLKPANILLDEDGNAYLSDFGIAKALIKGEDLTVTGAILGTPAYITPEQVQSLPVSPQTDIYALGVLLFNMLTGEHPFPKTSPGDLMVKHVTTPLPSIITSQLDLPHDLDSVIQKATAKNPAERYPDVPSFLSDFHQILDPKLTPPPVHPLSEQILGIANPYKGLRPFLEADAEDFFGREELTHQLLTRLGESGEFARFLVVVGPSGSGKSSLVKAGLLPSLRQGALPGSEGWFIITMTPASRPLDELEVGLLRVAAEKPPDLMPQLQRDSHGLQRAAQLVLPGEDDQLLLVVDQFEELFTLTSDPDQARHFMDLLFHSVTDPHSQVRVILTLRADFYDRPLMEPDFSALVQKRTEVVVPLSAAELERAICGPIERIGVSLEPGLDAEIIADVTDQPGSLPLLQYALTELFEHRQGRLLTREAYQSIGGVLGALGRRAEEVFQELDKTGQALSRQIFLRLVSLGEGVEDTRRRVLRSELTTIDIPTANPHTEEEAVTVDQVLESYGAARLLSFDHDPQSRAPTVEIAHEALLREWGHLRQWLDESRADIRLQRLLSTAAQDWLVSNQDPSFLLRGSRLAQFDEWSKETSLALTEDEKRFLQASLEDEAQRKEQQAVLERRSRNFLRALMGVFAVAAIVAIGLTIFAFNQQGIAQTEADARATQQLVAEANAATAQAESLARATQQVVAESEAKARTTAQADALEQKTIAEEQAQAAQHQADWNHSLALAAESQIALQANDRDLALALALAAIQIEDPPYQAQIALSEAAYAPGTIRIFSEFEDAVFATELSPDGHSILLAGADHLIRLWDLHTGEEIKRIEIEGELPEWFSVDFSPDGNQALVTLDDNSLVLLELESGETIQRMTGHNALVWGLAFSPDGQTALSASVEDPPTEDTDNSMRLWDLGTGTEMRRFEGHSGFVASIAFLPDGRRALTGSWADGSLILWDLETGGIISKWDYEPNSIVISPDGHTALFDIYLPWDLILLDLETGEEIQRLEEHNANILSVAISPDGQLALSGDSSGEIRVWDLGTGDLLKRFIDHSGAALSVDFNLHGQTFISGSEDTTMRLWTLKNGAEVGRFSDHEDRIWDLAYSPDGNTAISVAFGALHLWDLGTGVEIWRIDLPSPGWEVSYTPDGKSALVTLFEGGVMELDLATGEEIQRLGGEDQPTKHQDWVDAIAVSPNGKTALTGSQGEEDSLFLWDLESGEAIMSFQTEAVWSVDISPDGRTALSGGNAEGYGDVMTLWDLDSGEVIRQFEGHTGGVMEVAYSPDGRTALSGSLDTSLILWDLESGEIIHQLLGHTDAVRAVAISPDGRTAVSGSKDGILILWDLENGEAIRRYPAHSGKVNSVDFSPDGRTVLSGGDEGVMIEWRIDDTLEELIDWTLANRYLYELTCSERAQHGVEPLCEE